MIPVDILKAYGANEKKLAKGQILYRAKEKANYYYQILDGKIKTFNYNEDGKEIIQCIFWSGYAVGEPALLGKFPYVSSAEAIEDTSVLCLSNESLTKLLDENFDICQSLLSTLSKTIEYKSILIKNIKGFDAGHRILSLLNYLKSEAKVTGLHKIDMTRQRIADLTGLRVETVIRATKKLADNKQIIIKDRSIFI